MKIPETFKPEKNLEENIERLIKGPRYRPGDIRNLLQNFNEFLKQEEFLTNDYIIAQNHFVNKIDYRLKDVEEFVKVVPVNNDLELRRLGLYLSAMINKVIIKEDENIVIIDRVLPHVGAYLETGMIIVECDTMGWLGHYMTGGLILVKGNAGNYIGHKISGGEIIVQKNAGDYVAMDMTGGNIIVKGNAGELRAR